MGLRNVLVIIIVMMIPFSQVSAYATEGSFTLLNGETVQLSSYQGQFILIDGFATWCAPCELQMEYLHDVNEVAGDKAQLFSISFDTTDTHQKVEAFKNRFDAEWTFGIDETQSLNQYLDVQGYPTTFLLDEHGVILKKWLGLTDSEEILLEMDKYLDLPGSFGRQVLANDLVRYLLSSPFFIFFMIATWLVIFVVAARTIRMIRTSTR